MTSDPGPLAILFLIRRLDLGGSERQLVVLARGLAAAGHRVGVITFYPGGALEGELGGSGVRLMSLDKRSRWDLAAPLAGLARLLRREKPALLHGYLPVANVLALLMRPLVPGLKVIWGLRGSFSDAAGYDRARGLSFALERRLAGRPDLIIANSARGRDLALDRGYPAKRLVVVPNGIDTARFRPDAEARARQRAAWALDGDDRVIGMMARHDPVKDHDTFLAAARIAASERQDLRFVAIGEGAPERQAAFEARSAALGLGARVIAEGARLDPEAAYNGFDLATLTSSHGEGFPNALAEAMACGVPCVSTDVGDAARILGEVGLIVRPRDAKALARAWLGMLDRLAAEPAMQARVRERVIDDFSDAALIRRSTEALYGVLGRQALPRPDGLPWSSFSDPAP